MSHYADPATAAPMRILGKIASINVRKVTWTCGEIGAAYTREDWGSGFAPTDTPAFRAINPNGLVPVIQVERGYLWESNTICRYLAGRAGRADLLPDEPWQRAEVEKWMDWQATELNGAWRYAFLALVRADPACTEPDQIRASAQAWNRKMAILEDRLAETGDFAAGSTFTLADIGLGLSVNRWLRTPIERPDYPAVAAYWTRLGARPACREHGICDLP
jgi:glutathione S-transferase